MTTWDDLVRGHLLAELREVAPDGATTTQLARQTPWPWADLRAPDTLQEGCYASYVQPHLQALEAEGLVRRTAVPGQRHPVWRLVPAGGQRARIERTRR